MQASPGMRCADSDMLEDEKIGAQIERAETTLVRRALARVHRAAAEELRATNDERHWFLCGGALALHGHHVTEATWAYAHLARYAATRTLSMGCPSEGLEALTRALAVFLRSQGVEPCSAAQAVARGWPV